jgi:hypothetical protein
MPESCTAPAALAVDAVEALISSVVVGGGRGGNISDSGLDSNALAHVLVGALAAVAPVDSTPASDTKPAKRRCKFATGKDSRGGIERALALVADTLQRSASNEALPGTVDGLGTPHSGTEATSGLALLRLLIKLLWAVKTACDKMGGEWDTTELHRARGQAAAFLARRLRDIRADGGSARAGKSTKAELGRGLSVAVQLLAGLSPDASSPWFASDDLEATIEVIVSLARYKEIKAASALAAAVDGFNATETTRQALADACQGLGKPLTTSRKVQREGALPDGERCAPASNM